MTDEVKQFVTLGGLHCQIPTRCCACQNAQDVSPAELWERLTAGTYDKPFLVD